MADTVYVNMDAAWLLDLSQAETVTANDRVRLKQVAQHLESMDNKLQNLTAPAQLTTEGLDAQVLADIVQKLESGPHHFKPGSIESVQLRVLVDRLGKAYAAGRRDERMAMLSRSNLPVQSVELNPELARAIAAAPVKKLPPATKTKKKEPEAFKELDNLLLDVEVDDLF